MIGHKYLNIILKTYAKFMKIDGSKRLENINKYGTYLAYIDITTILKKYQ